MDFTILAVLAVLVLVAITVLAPRVGVAAPLLLVAAGVLISLVPGVPTAEVDPEIVLAGVLPPLLYASAVNMPALDFRRDLRTISGLSVVVVVVSAVSIGGLVSWLVSGLGFAEGTALGAILSPTDAVATSIVRRTGVAPRLITLLEGEALLNDATALVLLRSAVAAVAGSVSLLDVGIDFVQAVVVAVVIGVVVGGLSLGVRALVADATLASAISFVVPFIAYVPSERLGGSGLVAVVVAGLITGYRGVVELRAQDRLAEQVNWSTIAFLLESAVFLLMGLQVGPLVDDFRAENGSVGRLALLVVIGLASLMLVRAAYAGAVLLSQRRMLRSIPALRPRIDRFREYLSSPDAQRLSERRRTRAHASLVRHESDLRFYAEQPLGRRDGTVLVWAGMRGAVTLAAAQTLPSDTAQRPLLVLSAFAVAVLSLLVQGGSLAWLVRRLGVEADRSRTVSEQVDALTAAMTDLADQRCDDVARDGLDGVPVDDAAVRRARQESRLDRSTSWAGPEGPEQEDRIAAYARVRRAVLSDQRSTLVEIRASGRYDSEALTELLTRLDRAELALSTVE
ncbi:peptidase [Marmoricola endophyticus]|uniref:Peptidase n=1 Tax=Marmoricola endophyticus TaxID=2040280 RepID=A0A917F0C4_9ACTN|nr:cation:proton antiporter [Marmoricola endophyticus]GGF35759.1 peptidase [Marmoricola endophyticus]